MRYTESMKQILRRQGYHALAYVMLGLVVCHAVSLLPDDGTRAMGLSAREWMLGSWVFAGAHQFWIVLFWRLEFYAHKISAWLGPAGWTIYRIGFVVFAAARLLAIVPISFLTARSWDIPRYVSLPCVAVTSPLILWGVYSVFVHFGVNRAFGADHFDPAYRSASLEKRGIFKYVSNSMYTVVLLVLYHPGLLLQSWPGLLTAATQHAFVWCHYFCTEKPDMDDIYGRN